MNKLLLFVASLAILCSCQSKKTASEDVKPNIIYILSDDLGYGDVQCYNPEGKIPTPNMDAMASNGARFTDAHTTSAVCTPTRYSILTGRYNWRTSLKNSVIGGYSKSLIMQERTTVGEMLQTQGYTTAYIGKWHLGWDWKMNKEYTEKELKNLNNMRDVDFTAPIANGPNTHGFDYSFGFCGSLDMPPYVWVENGQPTMVPTETTSNKDKKGFWREGPTSADFVHEDILQEVTDRAKDYIAQQAKGDKPFFLYLPLPAPHTPILPPEEFIGKSNTNLYGDFVMQVDDVLGQVRTALVENGISENTILIFTSDNGCSPRADFAELEKVGHAPSAQFRGHKADIYEGGHRVPFMVEWPALIKEGKVVDATISTVDLFATCAELTNYATPDDEGVDSYSFLPLINGKSDKLERDYIVMHSIDGRFAIRKGDWKMSFCAGSGGWSAPKEREFKGKTDYLEFQLFNLKEDVAETNNLYGQGLAIEKELKDAMAKIILDGRSTEGSQQSNEGMEGWWQIKDIVN